MWFETDSRRRIHDVHGTRLGAFLRKETELDTPLIVKEMAKRVPDAGSYAPVTILLDERRDGVHLSYDRMASLLTPYRNAEVLAVARDLDAKIECLIRQSALCDNTTR
jgi:hypothetical protein